MRIDANTTDEKILANVVSTKAALVKIATEAVESEYLLGEKMVQAAQAVRNAEALACAQTTYRNICQKNPARRASFLFDSVIRTDDTWSGRGNDSTRSAQDAVRQWVENQMSDLRFEEEKGA